MLKFRFNRFALIVAATSALFLFACKKESKPKSNTQTPTTPYNSNSQSTPNPNGNTGTSVYGSGYEIYCSNASGDVLPVAINQTVTWTFDVRSLSGAGGGSITSITPSPQTSNLLVSGNSVQFTPRTQQELNGTLSVSGQGSAGESVQKIFSWRNGSGGTFGIGNNGGGIGGILAALLPSLLGGTGLGGGLGGLTGGAGGLGGLLGGTGTGGTGFTTPGGFTPGGTTTNGGYTTGGYTTGTNTSGSGGGW